ncbi:MAG: tyrosine-type recombinase/integrase [Acidobacteriota bacterium]
MTVYKRAGSKYWWIRLERNGKVVQESSEKLTKREAKLVEAQRRIEVWPELEGGKEMPTLVEFTRQLFPFWTRELKHRTAGYYKDAFAHLVDFEPLAHARLDDIKPRLIEQFKAHRQEQKAGVVNVNHSLRALRRALHLAVEWEYISKAPKISLRQEPKRDYVINEETFQKLLEKCGQPAQQIAPTVRVQEGANRQTMQALLTVLYDCGIRAGEACDLTWDRVNLAERWLFVDKGKTKAARRRVPLTGRAATCLTDLKKTARPTVPYVFTRHRGMHAITVCWASHEFTRVRRLLGLPNGCVLHSLRHSCASRLGNKGANTGDLMKWFGWETAEIAKRYVHLDDTRMATMVGLLEGTTESLQQAAGKQ